MKKSITNSVTSGQKKQIVKVCEEAAAKAARTAINDALLTRELAQRILYTGDKLQAQVKEVVAQFICAVSIELRAAEDAISLLRSLGLTLTTPAQPECKVAACFTNKKVFVYRDADFDNWLPAILPASIEVLVSGHELIKVTDEAELIKVGKPFTNLTQIENLILRTEKGEETGLITNGYANLFFLQVDSSVFAMSARRRDGGWRVGLDRFRAWRGWRGENRFFSLDPLSS